MQSLASWVSNAKQMAIEALIKPAKLLTVRKMGCLGLVAGLWLFALNTQAATGSWSSQVPSVMVAMSDRTSSSQAITPPAGVPLRNAVLSRIQWRFESPPGTPVNAWLCHPNAVLHYQACAVARPLYRECWRAHRCTFGLRCSQGNALCEYRGYK